MRSVESYELSTPASLQRLSLLLLRRSLSHSRGTRGAVVFSLEGELGSGKTTFVQGLGKLLGIRRPLQSPTFLIMREVSLPQPVSGIDKLYHFDWYRVSREKDILALGWQEIVKNERAVVAVEWGDRFPSLFPRGTTVVSLRHTLQGREAQVHLR